MIYPDAFLMKSSQEEKKKSSKTKQLCLLEQLYVPTSPVYIFGAAL